MTDKEMMTLWNKNNEKLDEVLHLNRELTASISKMNVKSLAKQIRPTKYLGLIIGIPWVVALFFIAGVGFLAANYFLAISFFAIAVITSMLVFSEVYQLIVVTSIDPSETIQKIQSKLSKIKLNELLMTRIAFLQIPFWSTFYLQWDYFHQINLFTVINTMVILSMCLLSIWLYRNISLENIDKKWMKILFSGRDWDPLIKAEEILEQL